jgi:hypothetical protein
VVTPPTSDDTDHGLGEFFQPFPQPVRLGELTVHEASEIKARNKVLERLNADIDHLVKARAIVSIEKVTYLRQIGSRFGMSDRDELNINDETGLVAQTGRRRFVQPTEATMEEVPNPEADPAPPVN